MVKEVFDKINEPFVKVFGVPFNKAQIKVPSHNLQMRQSATEKRKSERDWRRREKLNVENVWAERDCDNMLATRQSFSQRQKLRLLQHFETGEEAQQRAEKRKAEEELGNLKKKRHSPDPSDVDFDKEGLLDQVSKMEPGQKVCMCIVTIPIKTCLEVSNDNCSSTLQINYSDLARQYLCDTKLGGMVVKEFLQKQGVDLTKFSTYHKQTRSARRRLNRMTGGCISAPTPRPNSEVRETLKVCKATFPVLLQLSEDIKVTHRNCDFLPGSSRILIFTL